VKCPKCEFENPAGANFCNKCGARLICQPEVTISRPIPDAERKRVTALFSDLSGYTAITEKLDPEEVGQITGRIIDGIKAIVGTYEGFIEKFAGDGVLILFGVPRSHEDDPLRAIRAAKEVHGFVEQLSPQYEKKIGRSLSMHSGINTGLVVSGEIDPQKGTHSVTGDTINVASRLSDLAEAGDILVGAETYKASKGQFTFETLEPTKVKGKSEAISLYKLLSDRNLLSKHSGSHRRISSEMVGRDLEMDRLELQVMKAINGEGSVINVIGEAGIGKSRLMAELKKKDVMSRVTSLEGRAISIGKNLSFHPIIDLLKQWAEITEDDPENRALDKLEKAVKEGHPEQAHEILPFLATLMGMKLTGRYADRIKDVKGEALERLIVKNVRDLLIKGSEVRPIVFIMEDFHWADTSSIDLLDTMYRLVESHKIVFINVFRPGYLEPWNDKIAAIGQKYPAKYVEIELRPLEKHNCETLIENMLRIKGLPYGVRDQIVDRAGGNPFFIEEVVRSLIDEGAIVRGDTGFEVTEKIRTVVIPPTINDVLMARIDRLEEKTRELIKVASVIGRSFFVRVLKDVAVSIDNVDQRLSYLKDIQLIRDRIRMQEIEYLFKHALTQETAYESILLQKRGVIHLKVAQSIERLFESRLHEFYGMLAFHYGKGDAPEKVEEYMAKAGEEALRSSASSEALHYFREALKLYGDRYGDKADPEKLISFKTNLARAHLNRGEFLEAVSYLDDILDSKGYRFPRGKWISIVKGLWNLLGIINFLYSPIKFKTRIPDARELQVCDLVYWKGMCLVHTSSGRFLLEGLPWLKKLLGWDLRGIPQGPEWLSYSCAGFNVAGFSSLGAKLLERAKNISNDEGLNELGIALGRVTFAINRGSWGSVPDLDVSLLDTSLGKGDLYKLTAYLLHLGCIKLEYGNLQQAELCAEKLHLITESYGYDFARVHYHFVKTNILIRKGDFHGALTGADMGVSIAEQADMRPPKLRSLGLKIIVEMLLDRTKKAESSVKMGETLLAELGIVGPLYRAPFMLGRLLTDLGQLKEAFKSGNRSRIRQYEKQTARSVKQAVGVSKKHALYRTWIFKSVGEYYWFAGKQNKALSWWDKTIKEGEKLGANLDLSRTYFDIGKRLLDVDSNHKELNGIDAKGYLEKAQVLFEEIGLEGEMDELERLKADLSF
jgi:class 3 adenylate cyclase/tetratricopeptide (TPR) repeat protein